MVRLYSTALAVSAAVSLSACGGSGSSSAPVSGLSAPANVSIVAPEETAGPLPAATEELPVGTEATFPPTSDYVTDEVGLWVYDPAMDSLSIINTILCMVGQTAADQLVNSGVYTAQIDEDGCEAGQADDGGSGQSSAGGGSELQLWTVESTRASASVPQVIKLWVPADDPGDPGNIHAQMTLAAGASAANPFGVFSLNFVNAPDGGPFTNPAMFGNLSTLDTGSNLLGFSFYSEQGDLNTVPMLGDQASQTQVSVQMSEDKTSGTARILESSRGDYGAGDTGIQTSEYTIAFDGAHLLRELTGNAPVCVSRTDFLSTSWRYSLYYADNLNGGVAGDRVNLDSGFGFRTQAGEYGWLGYYGMWTPDGVAVNDGDTIERPNNSSPSASPDLYTVLKSPGKLIHNMKTELPLVDIDPNSRFRWWDGTSGTEFQVQYDGANWFKTDSWDEGSSAWVSLGGGPVMINVVAEGFLGMWSESLGGSVFYKNPESFITYYTEEFVNSSDPVFDEAVSGGLRLYGYFDALAAGVNQADADNGDVFLGAAPNLVGAHPFVFDEGTLTLMHDPVGDGSVLNQAGLAGGVVPTQGPFTWGMRSGPMLTQAQHDLLMSVDDVWLADDFYVYETGANAWNQSVTAIDVMGDAVVFEPPVQFTYTHTTATDANGDATYDGQSFLLSYNGPGDLYGVPSADNGNGRYYPLFSIESGTLVGPTGTEYVIKAVEVEQSLNLAVGQCGALDLAPAQAMVLPDGSNYEVPSMGARPVVTDSPAVITGTVQ